MTERAAVELSGVVVAIFLFPGAEPALVGVPLSSGPAPVPLDALNLFAVEEVVDIDTFPLPASVDSDFAAAVTFSQNILATVASENQSPQ